METQADSLQSPLALATQKAEAQPVRNASAGADASDPRSQPSSVHTPGEEGWCEGASASLGDRPAKASARNGKSVRFSSSSDRETSPVVSLDTAISAEDIHRRQSHRSQDRGEANEKRPCGASASSLAPSCPGEEPRDSERGDIGRLDEELGNEGGEGAWVSGGDDGGGRKRVVLRERAGPLSVCLPRSPEERINALLSLSLDEAAAAMNADARRLRNGRGTARAIRQITPHGEDAEVAGGISNSRSVLGQSLSAGLRRLRIRVATRENRHEEIHDEGDETLDEAEEDDADIAPWLRAFRKTLLLPLSVGTRGWKCLDRVEVGEPLADAALLAFAGSRGLSETDIRLLFEPFHPTAVLQLVPPPFFLVLFPSAAAAHAALHQRGENCMHLLSAGAEQLRRLQAEAVASRAAARRRLTGRRRMRDKKFVQERKGGDGRGKPGERGNEATGGGLRAEGKEEEEEGMSVDMQMEKETGTAEENEENEEMEEGEVEDEEEGQKETAVDEADLPEVFWLLGDVETHVGSKATEEFKRQAECWRRTLPILPVSSPRTATRLLLRVATAQELERCAQALSYAAVFSSPSALPSRPFHRDSPTQNYRQLPTSAPAEANTLSLSALPGLSLTSMHEGENGNGTPRFCRSTPSWTSNLSADAVGKTLRKERRENGREPETKIARDARGHPRLNAGRDFEEENDRTRGRKNLEEAELQRDQKLLTTLGGDFRSRVLHQRGGPDLGKESARVCQPSVDKCGKAASSEADRERSLWSKRLKERGGRSHGLLSRFKNVSSPRPAESAIRRASPFSHFLLTDGRERSVPRSASRFSPRFSPGASRRVASASRRTDARADKSQFAEIRSGSHWGGREGDSDRGRRRSRSRGDEQRGRRLPVERSRRFFARSRSRDRARLSSPDRSSSRVRSSSRRKAIWRGQSREKIHESRERNLSAASNRVNEWRRKHFRSKQSDWR
ncbi:hypothetical protein TGDOM2_290910 [Toxoplasma gondii GAB2-2007-GAL-DOM2]|uniref:Uncharacterized protein n=4 Tax=Toxoplasma gondii TaxID=5811 RepID=S7UQ25_TOXGG|nr:hypothetical protein TGGT1_290910 [Toxoplasma gondii GT1]KFG41314.1 hypothetical protein TGFOU_290910 [Toxoplasma gondii FOU]KFG42309.1 hypothetical protein TGDOM2_290910 [Toxoplasma gondii GAB2-2007-GAL-DOM2]RQX73643.1 hypothetical protein TGCAST_290910 [Toxoplasma gondii CAST]